MLMQQRISYTDTLLYNCSYNQVCATTMKSSCGLLIINARHHLERYMQDLLQLLNSGQSLVLPWLDGTYTIHNYRHLKAGERNYKHKNSHKHIR